MEDLTLRYYDAEMRYLREAAKEFAQTHPDRAAMLDLDKAGTPDPCVERLFEGFAFSMGRLREKIDDDLPEMTEGLVSMLWPHYLRTIPSLSVVAFTPALQAVKMAEVMPAGLEVYSRPVGPKNTVCRYRTTRDVMLNPLNISGVVRIYQLKDRKTFDSTDYPSLFKADSQAIRADLVAEKDIRLQPGGAVTVDMPMEESAQYVAVAGMFMSPDQENNTWRVVLSRDDLDPDKARVIEAGNNRLTLKVLKDE